MYKQRERETENKKAEAREKKRTALTGLSNFPPAWTHLIEFHVLLVGRTFFFGGGWGIGGVNQDVRWTEKSATETHQMN